GKAASQSGQAGARAVRARSRTGRGYCVLCATKLSRDYRRMVRKLWNGDARVHRGRRMPALCCPPGDEGQDSWNQE
ncbi:unnamed protein product, partial [Amoebophrya sp. A25]